MKSNGNIRPRNFILASLTLFMVEAGIALGSGTLLPPPPPPPPPAAPVEAKADVAVDCDKVTDEAAKKQCLAAKETK